MAETVNGGSGNQPPKKEMSMEIRLLIAFALMFGVMFLTPYILKNQAPVPQKAAQSAKPPAPAPEATPPAPAAGTVQAAAAEGTARKTAQQTLPPLVIDTE